MDPKKRSDNVVQLPAPAEETATMTRAEIIGAITELLAKLEHDDETAAYVALLEQERDSYRCRAEVAEGKLRNLGDLLKGISG